MCQVVYLLVIITKDTTEGFQKQIKKDLVNDYNK